MMTAFLLSIHIMVFLQEGVQSVFNEDSLIKNAYRGQFPPSEGLSPFYFPVKVLEVISYDFPNRTFVFKYNKINNCKLKTADKRPKDLAWWSVSMYTYLCVSQQPPILSSGTVSAGCHYTAHCQ